MNKKEYMDKYIAGDLHAEDLIDVIIKQDTKIQIAKDVLTSLAKPYGNPYNSQEGTIIARDSVRIAQQGLDKIR